MGDEGALEETLVERSLRFRLYARKLKRSLWCLKHVLYIFQRCYIHIWYFKCFVFFSVFNATMAVKCNLNLCSNHKAWEPPLCNLHASQMYVLISIDRRSIAKAIMAFLTYRQSLFYIFIYAFLYVFYVIPAPISCPCFAFFRISYLRISVFLAPALEKDPMAAFFRISAKTSSKSRFNANRNRVLSVQSVRVRRMYFSILKANIISAKK